MIMKSTSLEVINLDDGLSGTLYMGFTHWVVWWFINKGHRLAV